LAGSLLRLLPDLVVVEVQHRRTLLAVAAAAPVAALLAPPHVPLASPQKQAPQKQPPPKQPPHRPHHPLPRTHNPPRLLPQPHHLPADPLSLLVDVLLDLARQLPLLVLRRPALAHVVREALD
jgi:hypothetical protein